MELNSEQRRAAEAVRGPGLHPRRRRARARRRRSRTGSRTRSRPARSARTRSSRSRSPTRRRASCARGSRRSARRACARARSTPPRSGSCTSTRPERVGKILAVEGAAAAPDRELAARRRTGSGPPATSRPRSSGRRTGASRRDRYLAELGEHEPPIPPDLMRRVYRAVRAAQGGGGLRRLRGPARARGPLYSTTTTPRSATVRERYRAFTVDEYQDVNLLQQTLLELLARRARRALRRRRRLPVDLRVHRRVARASARDAAAVPARDRDPARGELPLDAAGARAREPARAEARRRGEDAARDARRRPGARAAVRLRRTRPRSPSSGSARSASRYEEVAILCRTNARLVDFEEALHEAGIPFQGASFLGRESARCVLRRLDVARADGAPARARSAAGSRVRRTSSASARWSGRTTSARLVRLAEELDELDGPGFVAELERRFGDGGEARRGVHLLTLHGAKGLEFEAVFVARVEEKELPSRLARRRTTRSPRSGGCSTSA